MESYQNEISKLNERINKLNERGQNLQRRESSLQLKILDTIKYLHSLINESNYNEKIISILVKYQQLKVRQQNLLERTIVSTAQKKEFAQFQSFLQNSIQEISRLEKEKDRVQSELESSFTAIDLQNDHFLFTLKMQSLEKK